MHWTCVLGGMCALCMQTGHCLPSSSSLWSRVADSKAPAVSAACIRSLKCCLHNEAHTARGRLSQPNQWGGQQVLQSGQVSRARTLLQATCQSIPKLHQVLDRVAASSVAVDEWTLAHMHTCTHQPTWWILQRHAHMRGMQGLQCTEHSTGSTPSRFDAELVVLCVSCKGSSIRVHAQEQMRLVMFTLTRQGT